jgi:hypothetical protein
LEGVRLTLSFHKGDFIAAMARRAFALHESAIYAARSTRFGT